MLDLLKYLWCKTAGILNQDFTGGLISEFFTLDPISQQLCQITDPELNPPTKKNISKIVFTFWHIFVGECSANVKLFLI